MRYKVSALGVKGDEAGREAPAMTSAAIALPSPLSVLFTVEIPGYLERGAMVAELHFPPL
jgi:hypothetical protein